MKRLTTTQILASGTTGIIGSRVSAGSAMDLVTSTRNKQSAILERKDVDKNSLRRVIKL